MRKQLAEVKEIEQFLLQKMPAASRLVFQARMLVTPQLRERVRGQQKALQLVQWLVEPGAEVLSGDRLAEVVAAGVLFYVQSPFNGMIVSLDKPTGAQVNPGNVLARMRIDES